MATLFSTHDVHPRERVSYWREVATRAYARHEFTSPRRSAFLGTIRSGFLAALGVALFECDPCAVSRTPSDAAFDGSDELLIFLQVAGKSIIEQDERHAVNEPGSMLLMDMRRPYSTTFPEQARAITLKVARPQLESRLGDLNAVTGRSLAGESPAAALASGFLSMLAARFEALDQAAGPLLAEQALDLVALAFASEAGQRRPVLSSARAAALLRLKATIEARLREPDLKPAAVAACAGMSVRYANTLLSREGFSIERYILHRRLERCRRALADPAQAHRMIGEIAFSWGFSDLSHFARRFRAVYGARPSDYRQRASEDALASAAGGICPRAHDGSS
jgi:AraC-like DNA-binding protein